MATDAYCPSCGGALDHDAVDIGVGTMVGPSFCPNCGWSEDCGPEENFLDSPGDYLEALAADVKKRDDELGHRMAMDVLGLQDDPLRKAIERVIPERVDIHGRRGSNKDRGT